MNKAVYYMLPAAGTAAVFFILPAVCPAALGTFLLLIVNPFVSFLASAAFGIYAGLVRGVVAMPIAVAILFSISVFFFYSSAEIFYTAVYLGLSVLGIGAGWLFARRGS